MDRNEIVEKLLNLKAEFDGLMPLFDTQKSGLSKQETLDYISNKYSEIKSEVMQYQKELEKSARDSKLNQDEMAFLVPAIREVGLHCTARKGSKNTRELSSSIYDAQDYCSYWISQLNA